MKVGEGNWDLGVDDSKLTAGLTAAEAKLKATGATGAAALGQTGVAVDQTSSKFGGLLGKVNMTSVAGTALGVGLGTLGANSIQQGITTVTRGILDTIDAASDMAEQVSKVDVVFGDSAAGIHQWAEGAAEDMGLSTRAATAAAGTFGNLFTAMGIGQPVAADMSTGLVQLAADLSSFNNVPVDDAIQALRSGLVGEIEPMRKFGVNLTEATIQAKAMELGLWNGAGAIDANAKAQASYALILEQTTNAQGDYARTADGLANTSKTVGARMEDLQVAIGQQLLPVALELLTVVGDLLDTMAGLGDALGEAYAPIANLEGAIGDLGDTARNAGVEIDPGAWAVSIHNAAVEGIDWLNNLTGASQKTADEVDSAGADIAVSAANMGGVMAQGATDSVDAVRKAAPEMGVAAKIMGDELKEAIQHAAGAAERIAAATPGKMADALREGRQDWKDALDQLEQDMKDSGTRQGRIAHLLGARASKRLAEGFASNDPLVRAAASEAARLIEEQLQIEGAYEWGGKIARRWADGMADEWGYAHTKAVYLGTAMSGPLQMAESPPYTKAVRIGRELTRAWAGGAAAEVGQVTGVGREISAAMARALAGRMPSTGSAGGSLGTAAALAGMGGGLNLTVNWHSLAVPGPAEGQRIARAIVPGLVPELRRQGIIGGRN